MKSNKELWQICKEIYRIMFKEASPSADFDKMIKSGETKEDDFFLKYFLKDERQKEIIDGICKEHKLTKREKDKVRTEVLLGCSPTINIENQKKTLSG